MLSLIDVTVVIPTVAMDELTEKCAYICMEHAPSAEIIIVADQSPNEDHPLHPLPLLSQI